MPPDRVSLERLGALGGGDVGGERLGVVVGRGVGGDELGAGEEEDVCPGLPCKLCVDVALEVRVAATLFDVERKGDGEGAEEPEPLLQNVIRRLTCVE